MSNHVKIHETRNLSEAHLVSAFLQSEGVAAEVRQGASTEHSGQIPLPASAAQVWVPAEQESQALELLEQAERASESSLHVVCPRCSERNPAHFELCWKCQIPIIRPSGKRKKS